MHEQKERLGLEHQQHRFVFRIVVEVLMHAPRFDDHDVAGLPVDAPAVVDVVAAPLDNEEHSAIQVAVLLAEGAGAIGFDVGLDRLADGGGARRNAGLAVMLRPALPGLVAEGEHARLIEQVLGQFAVGAFQRTHEGALLLPALPDDRAFAVVRRADGRRVGVSWDLLDFRVART